MTSLTESICTYIHPAAALPCNSNITLPWGMEGIRLLADKKNIHGAEVEVVEEGQSRETIICWMLSSIKLQRKGDCQPIALDPHGLGS